jgi:glucodextranase-like protein
MKWHRAARRKEPATLFFLAALLACMQLLIFGVDNGYAEVICSVYDDGNGDYQKSCSIPCGPADTGYFVDITLYGNNWYDYINGYGAVENGTYTVTLPCVSGWASGSARLDYDTDHGIDFGNWVRIATDTHPPVLDISTPLDNSYTNNSAVTVSGRATDDVAVRSITINGTAITLNADGTFNTVVTLVTGSNTITTIATDTANKTTTDIRTVTFDPTISCSEYDDGNGDYQKACSKQCGPSDAGYSVDITFYGNNWYDYINGYGAVENGTYRVTLPCVNGLASGSARLDYDTDHGIDFDNWARIPQ